MFQLIDLQVHPQDPHPLHLGMEQSDLNPYFLVDNILASEPYDEMFEGYRLVMCHQSQKLILYNQKPACLQPNTCAV